MPQFHFDFYISLLVKYKYTLLAMYPERPVSPMSIATLKPDPYSYTYAYPVPPQRTSSLPVPGSPSSSRVPQLQLIQPTPTKKKGRPRSTDPGSPIDDDAEAKKARIREKGRERQRRKRERDKKAKEVSRGIALLMQETKHLAPTHPLSVPSSTSTSYSSLPQSNSFYSLSPNQSFAMSTSTSLSGSPAAWDDKEAVGLGIKAEDERSPTPPPLPIPSENRAQLFASLILSACDAPGIAESLRSQLQLGKKEMDALRDDLGGVYDRWKSQKEMGAVTIEKRPVKDTPPSDSPTHSTVQTPSTGQATSFVIPPHQPPDHYRAQTDPTKWNLESPLAVQKRMRPPPIFQPPYTSVPWTPTARPPRPNLPYTPPTPMPVRGGDAPMYYQSFMPAMPVPEEDGVFGYGYNYQA